MAEAELEVIVERRQATPGSCISRSGMFVGFWTHDRVARPPIDDEAVA